MSPELRASLQAYAAKMELETDSQAARVILTTVLGIEEGASPKAAAHRAAINEAIWGATRLMQEVLHVELPAFADHVGKVLMKRLRAA